MRIWLILGLCLLASCSESPLVTGIKAETNSYILTQISKGMTQQEIYDLMGYPYHIEMLSTDNGDYEVWYYITTPAQLGQARLTKSNFTPLYFQEGILQGWGYPYYKRYIKGQRPPSNAVQEEEEPSPPKMKVPSYSKTPPKASQGS